MEDAACTRCGYVGPTRTHTPGSMGVELVLWLLLLVPGLIYSVWRISARREVCAACGSDAVVPTEKTRGREIVRAAGPAFAQALRRPGVGYAFGRALGRLFTRRK